MTGDEADWVSEAASLPVAFAQVREDPLLDIRILSEARRHARVLMVASGGCTAAALAALPDVDALHLVDPNPAQIGALKAQASPPAEPPNLAGRLELLGHAPLDFDTRAIRIGALLDLLELPQDALGPVGVVAALGPDHAGRYERLFDALRRRLAPFHQAIETLLRLDDPQEQESRVRSRYPAGTSPGRGVPGRHGPDQTGRALWRERHEKPARTILGAFRAQTARDPSNAAGGRQSVPVPDAARPVRARRGAPLVAPAQDRPAARAFSATCHPWCR